MATLCRNLEKRYNLKEVLSPRAFLSPKDRMLPRHDQRKEKLRKDIRQTLKKVTLYSAFKKQMQTLGYKVKIKGSEVGFSLAKIDRILSIKQQLEMNRSKQQQRKPDGNRPSIAHAKIPVQHHKQDVEESFEVTEKQLSSILYQLLKPEYGADYTTPELIPLGPAKFIKLELVG